MGGGRVALVYFFSRHHDIEVALLGVCFANIMVCMYCMYDLLLLKRKIIIKDILDISNKTHSLILTCKKAFPLSILVLCSSILSCLPRLLIGVMTTPANVVVYTSLIYFSVGAALITSAVANVSRVHVSGYYAVGDFDSIKSLVSRTVLGFLAIGFFSIIPLHYIGPSILNILYTSTMSHYAGFLYFILAFWVTNSISVSLGSVVVASGHYSRQYKPVLLSILSSSIMCPLLIFVFGFLGAFIDLILSSLIFMIFTIRSYYSVMKPENHTLENNYA